MKTPENIYLVGPMGAGKSTVGRHLARHLGKEFLDCDSEIEARTGATVALIFEVEGEEGFRKRESGMLEELTGRSGIVLATGGGAVLDADNRARLRTNGFVVYLCATVDLLVQRTSRDRNRPLLQEGDRRERIEALLLERDPLYRQVADLTVTTDRRSPRHMARDIIKRVEDL